MEKPLVSVYTCVYNRADKIHRVFNSMKAQTYKNLEHIVVDDGSTDNVLQLLEQYSKEVSFPVYIYHKENGGKHTATNVAWNHCNGEYLVQLDSDDELFPDGIEKLVGLLDNVPVEKRKDYWCYVGRCVTQKSDNMVGLPYPDGINSQSREEASRTDFQVGGEKIALISASAIGSMRFPEPVGVKFVSERVVWEPMKEKYKSWYSNLIIRKYYVDEGNNLSNQKISRQTVINKVWSCRWQLENRKKYQTKGLKCLLPYCFGFFLTSKEYRKGNPYLVHGGFVLYLLQLILAVPAWVSHFIISIILKFD